eukprot:GHUV01028275.1.p2 GENE.GHUV01028275.1~~GHUV01028275.1.p2  ORF type:complete len:112 (-),score=17.81 GHUV01028275.1:237-572(-)
MISAAFPWWHWNTLSAEPAHRNDTPSPQQYRGTDNWSRCRQHAGITLNPIPCGSTHLVSILPWWSDVGLADPLPFHLLLILYTWPAQPLAIGDDIHTITYLVDCHITALAE